MYHLAKSLYLMATSKEEYSVILLGLDNAGKTTFHEQVKSIFQAGKPAPHARLETVPTIGQNVSTIELPDMYLKIWDVGGQLSLRKLWQSYYASCHAIIFIIDSTDIGDGELHGFPTWHNTIQPNTPVAPDTPTAMTTSTSSSSMEKGHVSNFTARMAREDGHVRTRSQSRTGWDGDGSDSRESPSATFSPAVDNSEPSEGRLDECRLVLEDVLQNSDTEGVPLLVLANKQDREDCVEVVRIKEGLVKKVFEGEKADSIRDSRVLPISALNGTGVREAIEWVRARVNWNKESRPPVMR